MPYAAGGGGVFSHLAGLPAVTLAGPSVTIDTASPTFTWNAVPGATGYYLWVIDSSGTRLHAWYTSAQAGCAGGTGSCSVTPTLTLAAGPGQWTVEAANAEGVGPWNSPLSFTVSGPSPAATLVSPQGTMVTSTPTYTWNAVPAATDYYLSVTDGTGGSPVVQLLYSAVAANCPGGTGTCSVTPPTALAAGSAQWSIQTRNTYGAGPTSHVLGFTVPAGVPGAPSLMSPQGTISTATPIYTWNAVDGAGDYYLSVTDATGVPIQTWYTAATAGCASGTGTCSVTPATAIAGAAQWSIRARSAAGTGPTSSPMDFIVSIPLPATPTAVSPQGTITTATPTYTWNAVARRPTTSCWWWTAPA